MFSGSNNFSISFSQTLLASCIAPSDNSSVNHVNKTYLFPDSKYLELHIKQTVIDLHFDKLLLCRWRNPNYTACSCYLECGRLCVLTFSLGLNFVFQSRIFISKKDFLNLMNRQIDTLLVRTLICRFSVHQKHIKW